MPEFAEAVSTLESEEKAVLEVPVTSGLTPEQAIEYMRNLPKTITAMGPQQQGPFSAPSMSGSWCAVRSSSAST
jgi:hypothetical protein